MVLLKNVLIANENKIHMKDEFLDMQLNTVKEEKIEEDIIEVDRNGLYKEEEQIYIKK